jgi:hypothetical protein
LKNQLNFGTIFILNCLLEGRAVMKIKSNFAKRKIADSNIVVPVGPGIKDFNGMITLNDSASFFWDCMINETTEEDVIEKVIDEYDIDKETAKRDIEKFIKMLEDNNLLE